MSRPERARAMARVSSGLYANPPGFDGLLKIRIFVLGVTAAAICSGLGVEPAHVREIVPVPKEHEKNVAVLREEIGYAGPSIVIARRECLQTARRAKRPAREGA
jgi:hypothetical protein